MKGGLLFLKKRIIAIASCAMFFFLVIPTIPSLSETTPLITLNIYGPSDEQSTTFYITDAQQIELDTRLDPLGKQLEETQNVIENFNCIVIGKTNNTWVFHGTVINDIIGPIFDLLFRIRPSSVIFLYLFGIISILFSVSHLRLNTDICFGSDYPGNYNHSSDGWIWTKGTNGVVEATGSFYGTLGREIAYYRSMLEVVYSNIGITGFRGYRFGLPYPELFSTYYIGYADHVSIEIVE
jgi:hypothetical protein